MHCGRDSWTLVRYAGPASKALIGSKPVGSELALYVVVYPQQVNKKLTFRKSRSGPAVRKSSSPPSAACISGREVFIQNQHVGMIL